MRRIRRIWLRLFLLFSQKKKWFFDKITNQVTEEKFDERNETIYRNRKEQQYTTG